MEKLSIKMQSLSVFLDTAKVTDSGEKILISAEFKGCLMIHIFFGSSLGKV